MSYQPVKIHERFEMKVIVLTRVYVQNLKPVQFAQVSYFAHFTLFYPYKLLMRVLYVIEEK